MCVLLSICRGSTIEVNRMPMSMHAVDWYSINAKVSIYSNGQESTETKTANVAEAVM